MECCGVLELWSLKATFRDNNNIHVLFFMVFTVLLNMNLLELLQVGPLAFFVSFFFSSSLLL